MARRTSSTNKAASHRSPELFTSLQEKDALEARNGLLQFDETLKLISAANGQMNLSPELLKHLQQLAIQDIYICAGNYRECPIFIGNSLHKPPEFAAVPKLVEEMCDYANTSDGTAVHISAYLMWRINWIHPFAGGNGRTSRAVSYYALCTKFGMVLPGTHTIPDLIAADRQPYYDALDAADAAWRVGTLDVSVMEELVEELLKTQLSSIV